MHLEEGGTNPGSKLGANTQTLSSNFQLWFLVRLTHRLSPARDAWEEIDTSVLVSTYLQTFSRSLQFLIMVKAYIKESIKTLC